MSSRPSEGIPLRDGSGLCHPDLQKVSLCGMDLGGCSNPQVVAILAGGMALAGDSNARFVIMGCGMR
jgi:hypothetical protein